MFSLKTGVVEARERLEELEDVPLYYELARLCNITKLSQGKMTLYLSAILHAGYRVSLTHANKVNFSKYASPSHSLPTHYYSCDPEFFQHGIKTDAPPSFLWSMMRAWSRHIGKEKNNLNIPCIIL